jgi:hypothetical protein
VYGTGPLAHCELCGRRGHATRACDAPSMYIQCESNGLDDDFCTFIQSILDGASAVFAGTNPMRKGDKTFGFAIFDGPISAEALAGAAALYSDGVLSQIPRITSGVHACRDCGQLDIDAQIGGRIGAHASADSPLCSLHRREVISGRKFKPSRAPPRRATPSLAGIQWAVGSAANASGSPSSQDDTAMADVGVTSAAAADTDARYGVHSPIKDMSPSRPVGPSVPHLGTRPGGGRRTGDRPCTPSMPHPPPGLSVGQQACGGWSGRMARGRHPQAHGAGRICHRADPLPSPACPPLQAFP